MQSSNNVFPFKSIVSGAGKMAQRIKVLATKTDGLRPIPQNHMMERENTLYSHDLSSDLHMLAMSFTCPHTYTLWWSE